MNALYSPGELKQHTLRLPVRGESDGSRDTLMAFLVLGEADFELQGEGSVRTQLATHQGHHLCRCPWNPEAWLGRGMERNKSILTTDPKVSGEEGDGCSQQKGMGHISGNPAAPIPGPRSM